MKKLIFLFGFLLMAVSIQSQEVKKQKNAKVSIEVDGVCKMCKKRIETAALKTKGVKIANWNVETHQLNLIIDERKTNLKTIQANIAEAGHDTKTIKATDDAYNSVAPCCKYRDKKVVENHK